MIKLIKSNPVFIHVLGIFVLGITLTIFFTYPFILKLSTNYPARSDFLSQTWTYWYTSHSIFNGTIFNTTKFFTQPQYYPFPLTLAQADFFVIPSLLFYAPASLISNSHVFGVNFTIFTSFVLNFVSCYFCLNKLTKHKLSSIIGALIFTFSPSVIEMTSGYLEYLSRFFIPPLFLFMHNFFETPNSKNAFKFFVVYLLCWFSNIEISIFVTVLGTIWFVVFLILKYFIGSAKKIQLAQLIKYTAIYSLVLAPIVFYFFSPYINYSQKENFKRSFEEIVQFSVKPLDYFLPSPDNVVFGKIVKSLESFRATQYEDFNYSEHTLSPGIVALVIIFISVINILFSKKSKLIELCKRESFLIICFIVLIITVILTFGPYINIDNHLIKLPYYYLYKIFPLLAASRTPGRFKFVLLFFIAYIVANTLSKYLEQNNFRKRNVVLFIVFGLIVVEYITFFRPESHLPTPINFNFAGNVVLFLPIRSIQPIQIRNDDSEYLIQQVTNNLISVNGSTGSEDTIHCQAALKDMLSNNIFSNNWFRILKNLNIRYVAIDKTALNVEYFSKQNKLITNYTNYPDLIVFEDDSWAIIDIDKYNKISNTSCMSKGKSIGDTSISIGAYYRSRDKSFFITYSFANNLGCDLVFINQERYLKVNYKTDKSNKSRVFYIVLPPIISNNHFEGGKVIIADKLNIKPSKITINIDGSLNYFYPRIEEPPDNY
jgi:hypothetical protein